MSPSFELFCHRGWRAAGTRDAGGHDHRPPARLIASDDAESVTLNMRFATAIDFGLVDSYVYSVVDF